MRYLVCILVLASSLSLAEVTTPPALCEEGGGFTDFDFWVGDWKVYSNDEKRQFYGDNTITKHHGDCLLREDWRSASGSAGSSINYFNAVTDEWRQVWVANGYAIDYTGGLNDAGAMVLTGSIYNYSKRLTSDFRGTWIPVDADNVIQRFEIFDAEKQAWSLWFEGLYVRQN